MTMASKPASVRSARAPQCEQNFAPRNIIPKHEGHATVANRAPQCAQLVESVEAGAPHIGQLRVSPDMIALSLRSQINPQAQTRYRGCD